MRVAILGAGKQAQGALHYLQKMAPATPIGILDSDVAALARLQADYPSISQAEVVDGSDERACARFLSNYDVAFNALPYYLGVGITRAAIYAKCSIVDLGGNSEVVSKQHALNGQAVSAGVSIIPDCGLAPGLVSILAADAVYNAHINLQIHSIKIYVGGLPRNKRESGLLEYGDFFSFAGLVNEYTQPVKILRNGKIQTIDPLTELESIYFGEYMVDLEAFTTSGGSSTLPESFLGVVDNLEYKTLRFPGHLKALKLLQAVDAFNVETLQKLCPAMQDQVFVRVDVKGLADGDVVTRQYSLHDCNMVFMEDRYPDKQISSMMRCTAYPAAAIMTMLPSLSPGVHRQERAIDTQLLISKLRKAGLNIVIKETTISS